MLLLVIIITFICNKCRDKEHEEKIKNTCAHTHTVMVLVFVLVIGQACLRNLFYLGCRE